MVVAGAAPLDATLRHVKRLGWRLSDDVTLAIAGRNLLHEDHQEYTVGTRIPRSVFVDLQWRF